MSLHSEIKPIGVIPARYHSSRLPQKLLQKIGAQTLIEKTLSGALSSKKISKWIVATDHESIAKAVESLGVTVIMTPPELPSGSHRVWEAIKDKACDVVINVQGDEPLVRGEDIDHLVEILSQKLKQKQEKAVATLSAPLSLKELKRLSVVKVIKNIHEEAIYFSRFPIPYSRLEPSSRPLISLKHVGLYGYTKKALESFVNSDTEQLGHYESLEQLRFLYLGIPIYLSHTTHSYIAIDTQSDLDKFKKEF